MKKIGLRIIDNGSDIKQVLFPAWPHFDQDEIDAATAVLQSGRVNYWTGQEGKLFEEEFASFVGCKHAIAVANGTVALELALHALGIGPGDEVIVASRTFIASASCIVMRGARPVIADVDPVSQNITAETIVAAITPRTRVIITVHLAGWPCDMDPILDLARKHNLYVIEDCAQAHGATYKGRPVGSIGDVAAFSFCQDKIMTTGGEGGMLTTSDKNIWEKAWEHKDHGKSYDAVFNRNHPTGFRWLHESFGTNLRLTEMQSAIGRVALKKLPSRVEIRRRNAAALTERFLQIPSFRVTIPSHGLYHSYYKYYVFVRPETLKKGWGRDRIMAAIQAEGIPCSTGTCSEIYLEKAFEKSGLRPSKRFEVARELGETSLMFLVHPTLSVSDMENVCLVVEKVMDEAADGNTPFAVAI